MKVLANKIIYTSLIVSFIFFSHYTHAQPTIQKVHTTFKKKIIPLVIPRKDKGTFYYKNPYGSSKLDYHDFKSQGENPLGFTNEDWYLKYKKMFDFRCKEPFWGGYLKYEKNDYDKSGYTFRLIDKQEIEDSIQFLMDKYACNNKDILQKWNLPNIFLGRMEHIIKRLGVEHFKIIVATFDSEKYSRFIDVPEAEQANDNMVMMEYIVYPADVDIFLYNWQTEKWGYIESLTVSGDHDLEVYVLQKFEPRYLKNCK